MKYNHNTILDILRDKFWDEIEGFTGRCVLNMDSWDRDQIFQDPTDYAVLDSINEMWVTDFDTEPEDDSQELVTGVLELRAAVDGYAHWDGEDVRVDSGEMELGISFSFYEEDGKYEDLDLEYIY